MREHNHTLPLRRCIVAPLCLALCLVATSAAAQKGKIIKGVFNPEAAKKAAEVAIKTSSFKYAPVTTDFTNASGIRLDPKGARHSITPSANTILGSEKIPSSGWGNTTFTKNISARIPASERPLWKRAWNKFASLAYYKPSSPEELKPYLLHSVPKETYTYIQERYSDLISKTQQAAKRIAPLIVYSSLPNEGTRLSPEAVGELSDIMYPIILQIHELRTALPKEPFLQKQQEAWEQAFTMVNPLLACVVIHPSEISTRVDREFDTKEFNLYNPDGTDYLLPRSETLLVDPDEMDEMESYAAVREKMRNPPIKPEAAEAERTVLLNQLPSNMRIALVNDDLLPRINFEGWAKKGYLGHNATIETFKNGNDFMTQVRNGGKYDLVITDLIVTFGGLTMLPELRSLDKEVVVIVSSKNDRGDDDPAKMFNLGADGYMWYTNNLNEGAYGYIEYLRAMRNYFYYKQKHNWHR